MVKYLSRLVLLFSSSLPSIDSTQATVGIYSALTAESLSLKAAPNAKSPS
jgi:hypothetical protein